MFPNQGRLRNFTYASAMTVDLNIKYIIRSGNNLDNCQTVMRTLEGIHIGKLPIMLKSCVCILNQYTHVNNDIILDVVAATEAGLVCSSTLANSRHRETCAPGGVQEIIREGLGHRYL